MQFLNELIKKVKEIDYSWVGMGWAEQGQYKMKKIRSQNRK